jgi:hypothetical protein
MITNHCANRAAIWAFITATLAVAGCSGSSTPTPTSQVAQQTEYGKRIYFVGEIQKTAIG